jgi:hypothetical protein
MATPKQHLHPYLSDQTFCNLTGLSEGLGKTLICTTCKGNIVEDDKRLGLIEHMLFGVLKITHEIYSRLKMASLGFPLEQPSIIVPDTEIEENKGEVDGRVEETLVSVVKPRDWLAKLKRQSSATATKYDRHVR